MLNKITLAIVVVIALTLALMQLRKATITTKNDTGVLAGIF